MEPILKFLQYKLQEDLNSIANWLLDNKLSINVKKCKLLKISTPQHRTRNIPINIFINNVELEQTESYKYLGYWLDETLTYGTHIDKIVKKVNQRIGLIKHASQCLNRKYAVMLYKSLVLPTIDYGDTLYSVASDENLQLLQVIQNKFARSILKVGPLTPSMELHNRLKLMKLLNRRNLHFALLVFKTMKGLVPGYLSDKLVLIPADRARVTRATTRGDIQVPHTILARTDDSFTVRAAKCWNEFTPEMKAANTVQEFKRLYIESIGYV